MEINGSHGIKKRVKILTVIKKTQEESTMNNVERLKNYQNRNAATIEALYRAVLQD